MSLIRAQQVSLAFGARAVLDEASFVIEPGARVALVGRNGEGKSTLMKLLAEQLEADAGEVAVGKCIVEFALERVHRSIQGRFEDVGAVGVVPVPELRVPEPRLVALPHQSVTLRVIAVRGSGPVTLRRVA